MILERMYRFFYLYLLLMFFYGCTDSEVILTHDNVKDSVSPTPIMFSPYVGSSLVDSVSTRADLNLLSSYGNDIRYRNIPFLGEQRNTNRRLGHSAYNNYIVGVYGFWHDGSNWETDKDKAGLQADFMTNQPLLHLWKNNTTGPYWTYSPLKYWPNNSASGGSNGYSTETDKVTFISYYPFQDYSGGEYYKDGTGTSTTEPIATLKHNSPTKPADGIEYLTFQNTDANKTKNNLDLTCITPPAKDATGEAAYTFGFQQKAETKDHLDFMIGINQDVTKQDIGSNVTLNLRHALCLVRFKVNFYPVQTSSNTYIDVKPTSVEWEVNSVTLTGMYDKGTVKPVIENGNVTFDWELDENEPQKSYQVFTHDTKENDKNKRFYPYYYTQITENAGYDPSKPIAGNNKKYIIKSGTENATGSLSFYTNQQGEGYKWFILALPQTANEDTYIDVDYDFTYTYDDDDIVVYKGCKEHIKVPNNVNFQSGKYLEFTLNFYLHTITMDATMADWDEEEYYNIEEGKGVVEE